MRVHTMLLTTAMTLCASAALAAPTKPTATIPPRDEKVWTAAQSARADQMKLWEEVVNIDSGTGDVEGGRKVAAVFRERLAALGGKVESVPAEAEGLPDNTVVTFTGTGKTRILIIAHIDTVFGPGTVARWPFRVDGDTLHGPGVGDEKGGVVEATMALGLLKQLGFNGYGRIAFLIETSEERGSPGTHKLIDRLLKDADVELNMEPGDAPDMVTVWRKGSATYHITVKGRAAHAGVAPQEGRNAAVELIHQLKTVEAMPHSGSGMTANLTILKAGSRENIIPEDAEGQVNVRARTPGDFDKVEAALKASAAHTLVPDTTVTVTHNTSYPPLATNPATQALAARARAIYAGMGKTLGEGGNGGASESALAAAAGVPALDGLGPVGGGFHSEKEFVDLRTVTPRLYLMTKLLMDLSANPPSARR